MTIRITQQQLESYLWDAAVLLRGTIDAGDYNQFPQGVFFQAGGGRDASEVDRK